MNGAMEVGFVGWRGMVGSVLRERMQAEDDFPSFSERLFLRFAKGRPGTADRRRRTPVA